MTTTTLNSKDIFKPLSIHKVLASLAFCLLVIALFSCDSNSEKETKTEEYTEPTSEKLYAKPTKEERAKQKARLKKVPLPF